MNCIDVSNGLKKISERLDGKEEKSYLEIIALSALANDRIKKINETKYETSDGTIFDSNEYTMCIPKAQIDAMRHEMNIIRLEMYLEEKYRIKRGE